MANPPSPYDVLSLMLAFIKYGGASECAVRIPAGSNLHLRTAFGDEDRALWIDVDCLVATTENSRTERGEAAARAIAEQRLHPRMHAQIIDVRPKASVSCQCRRCETLRQSNALAKLIGEHPPGE